MQQRSGQPQLTGVRLRLPDALNQKKMCACETSKPCRQHAREVSFGFRFAIGYARRPQHWPVSRLFCTRRLTRPLLPVGAGIHDHQPTMHHCKVMIVNQLTVSVGSTNFDNRSFCLNDKANLNVYVAAFAARQTEVFALGISLFCQVTLAQWEAQPLKEKLMDQLAPLAAPQL